MPLLAVNTSGYVAGAAVKDRPLKVATPFTAVTVVVPLKVCPAMEIVTDVLESAVTMLPPESCTCTTGWVVQVFP